MHKKLAYLALVSVLLVSLVGIFGCAKPTPIPPTELPKIHFRLGTSTEGSGGYACGLGVAAVVNKYCPHVSFDALVTAGSTATIKTICKSHGKELEGGYTNTWGCKDLYEGTGPFAEAPCEYKALQGWWFLPMQLTYITLADRDDINNLHDLAGKKVFSQKPGMANFDACKAALTAIGVWDDVDVRTIDFMASADALKMGTVDAVVATIYYMGKSGAPWMTDVDARCDIKAVVPTPEEIKAFEAVPGLGVRYTNCADWLSGENAERWPDHVAGFAVTYGFPIAPCVSTEHVYEIYKCLIEHADELAPYYATLANYAEMSKREGPLALQIASIDSVSFMPVHPGIAKYLKEQGVWKDTWKVGELDPTYIVGK